MTDLSVVSWLENKIATLVADHVHIQIKLNKTTDHMTRYKDAIKSLSLTKTKDEISNLKVIIGDLNKSYVQRG